MWRILISLLLCSCSSSYYRLNFLNVTNYTINPDEVTSNGVRVDTSGKTVDLVEIDQKITQVENCLKNKYPTGKLPNEIIKTGQCVNNWFDTNINRAELVIKIAPDFHIGCAGEELFPCGVDPKLCEAKGLTPTAECPCECRVAIQDNHAIVVTPNLYLLKADMIRLQTGCNFIWIPGLQECF